MNLQFYKEKLESSSEFKNFKKSNLEAYLSSAFFTINITDKTQDIENQLDYFNQGKFTVFIINNKITSKQEDAAKNNIPEKLTESKLEINKLPEICNKLLENNKIQEKLIKIIAILSSQNSQPTWSLNCITSAMTVIKIKLDDSGKKLNFEKLNLFDFVKK